MMELESDLLIKLLFIFGIVFLLWIWSFWRDLENTDEFHPDGLTRCPPETYTILEDDSRNSSKVRCVSCPVCPAGEEPLPPCGTTLAIKTPGECNLCKPGTYSDGFDSAACKACTDCGSRNVNASCTAEKNTKCEDCPWRYYEDDATQICKHCSSCCGKNSPAELECFKTKKCRARCTRTTTKKNLSTIFNRLVERSRSGSYNTTPILSGTNLQKDNQNNLKSVLDSVFNTEDDTLIHSEIKRDVRIQNGTQEDYKDSANDQTAGQLIEKKELEDLEFLKIPDIPRNVQEQADILAIKQDPSPTKNNFKGFKDTNTNNVENEDLTIQSQALPEKNRITFQQTESTPTTAENSLGQLTPHNSLTLASTSQTQLVSPSSFISSFVGTFAAFLVFGLIGLIIYVVFKKCVHKIPKGYKKLRGSPKLGEHLKETSDDESNEDFLKAMNSYGPLTIANLKNTTLSELPPDLEDLLVKKLDVCCKGERLYGWQKVGAAFKIPSDDLKYLHVEYKRDNGSPTSKLLSILGVSYGKTVSDLVDVLKSPKVNLPDVASIMLRSRGLGK